jgi:hypothetical protein
MVDLEVRRRKEGEEKRGKKRETHAKENRCSRYPDE